MNPQVPSFNPSNPYTIAIAFSHNLRNRLSLNHTLLLIITTDAVIIIAEICAFHVSQKFLVVGNNDKLEV